MHQVFPAVSTKPHLSAVCRVSLAVGLLYLGLAFLAIARAAPADREEGSRTGNILLREYFLGQWLELHGERTMFPGSESIEERAKQPLDPMAEHFINTQVDLFIRELERKLGTMKSTVKELETVRQDAVSGQSTEDPSKRARMRELAGNVGDQAGDLYDMVAVVVIDLRAKKDAGPPSSPESEFLANELTFLRKQVGKAEGRIKALFLQPTHTVDLDELRGDNVLTELKAIEQVSKDIKKKALAPGNETNMAE